jgi:hypothetical protein
MEATKKAGCAAAGGRGAEGEQLTAWTRGQRGTRQRGHKGLWGGGGRGRGEGIAHIGATCARLQAVPWHRVGGGQRLPARVLLQLLDRSNVHELHHTVHQPVNDLRTHKKQQHSNKICAETRRLVRAHKRAKRGGRKGGGGNSRTAHLQARCAG